MRSNGCEKLLNKPVRVGFATSPYLQRTWCEWVSERVSEWVSEWEILVPCEVHDEPEETVEHRWYNTEDSACSFCVLAKVEQKVCIECIISLAQPVGSTPLDEIDAWYALRIPTDERDRGAARECLCNNRYWSVIIDTNISYLLYLIPCDWPESHPCKRVL
jgi:hypothetical protein